MISFEPSQFEGSLLLDYAFGVLFVGLLVFCGVRCALQPRQCAARPVEKAQ